MDCREFSENYEFFNPVPSEKKVASDDEAHLKKYIMWENKSNICWLDASLALVAHNKVMKKYSVVSPGCVISRIISAYDDAIRMINNPDKSLSQQINLARGTLNYIQESTLQYLRPLLKYKTGAPESAFCSLYNLLIQDSDIKKIFDVTWISVKKCTDCDHHSESTKRKPIVTLSNVDSFDPENLAVIYRCACNRSEQKIKVVYVSLPPCLIFHFENGAGQEPPPSDFTTRGRKYYLTGIMTLEKGQDSAVNHFITWVRDPSVNKFLDCNDLNSDIICFSPNFPDIDVKDVYMYVYESFDDLGMITDPKLVKTERSEENIPCIDLSGDSDPENSNLPSIATESNKDTGKVETLASDLKSSNDKVTLSELTSSTSLKRSLSTENESTINKNIQHVNFTQNLKNTSNNTVHINENQIKATETDEDTVQGKSIKTDKIEVSETLTISPDINLTSIDDNSTKEINANICKSDFSEYNDKITTDHVNSCLIPSTKEALKECKAPSISTDGHENLEGNCKKSAESESSFHNEEKQNLSLNTTENNQNKELPPKEVCSNTSDRKPAKSKSLKVKDLIKIENCDKTNVKKDDMNNSEQFFTISNAMQCNTERLVLNSTSEQEILRRGQFLTDAAANISGTSYVKLSVRRKKFTNPLSRKNFGNDANNSDSGEIFHSMAIDIPSSSKSLTRNRVEEDCDNVSTELSAKRKKLSNVKRDTVSPKEKGHYSKFGKKAVTSSLKKKSLVKSKLNHMESKKMVPKSSLNAFKKGKKLKDHHKSVSEKEFQAGAVSEAKNSNNEVKILQDFEDVWSCHTSDCNCDFADMEQTIDIVVDYTFAYIHKLSEEFKKSSTK